MSKAATWLRNEGIGEGRNLPVDVVEVLLNKYTSTDNAKAFLTEQGVGAGRNLPVHTVEALMTMMEAQESPSSETIMANALDVMSRILGSGVLERTERYDLKKAAEQICLKLSKYLK